MSLWCLGDVRPMDEAKVVEVAPRAVSDVLGGVARGSAVAVTPRLLGPALPASVSCVELAGVPPSWYFAHTRSDEPRRVVTEVLRLLASIPVELPA